MNIKIEPFEPKDKVTIDAATCLTNKIIDVAKEFSIKTGLCVTDVNINLRKSSFLNNEKI